jgi:NDP-hexose-3-ketoreductase
MDVQSERPLRFGVLGCADIAWRRVLPALRADESVQLVAIASRNPDKARLFAERFKAEAVVGYQMLLDRSDIDAVYVPLPVALHQKWVARSIAAGKHVLAEKALTTRARHTADLYKVAAGHGLVVWENVMFVHHSQHSKIRELVTHGTIGELRSFSSTFTIPPRPPSDIRYAANLAGGALYDIAPYPIRAAMLFLQERLSVVGAVLRLDRARRIVLSGSVLLRTAAGTAAHLEFGMEHAYRSSYRLTGSSGHIILDRAFTPSAHCQPFVRVERSDRIEMLQFLPDDQVVNTVRAFRRAVLAGDTTGNLVNDSIAQARLIDDVRALADVVPV